MLRAMNHFQHEPTSAEHAEAKRHKWFIAAKEQRERQEHIEDKADEAFMEFATSVILATQAEIEAFHVKLDTYDEATVKALMINQEALDAVNAEIFDMLSRAHELEDGRRVFKTEDGTQVFDEHGSELGVDVIHPDAIADGRQTWEAYKEKLENRDHLEIEREAIHEYQDKLDNARERSSSDDFTKEELDELDAELEADMPLAVKREMPDYDPSQEVKLTNDFATSVKPSLSEFAQDTVKQAVAPIMN